MNLFDLILFLLICAGLGFLGHLVSPRYGWFAGAVLSVPVFILLFIGSFKEALNDSRKKRRERRRTNGANL
jgi:hypothetical protein